MKTSAPAWRIFVFVFGAAADGNDNRFVGGVGLDAAADFHSIDSGNHDVQNEEVGFYAADFEQCRDAVGSGRDFITALPLRGRISRYRRFRSSSSTIRTLNVPSIRDSGVGI